VVASGLFGCAEGASAMRRHIQRITNRYGFVATLDTTGVTLISSGDLRDG